MIFEVDTGLTKDPERYNEITLYFALCDGWSPVWSSKVGPAGHHILPLWCERKATE